MNNLFNRLLLFILSQQNFTVCLVEAKDNAQLVLAFKKLVVS